MARKRTAAELEAEIIKLKRKIAPLEHLLEVTKALLHQVYLQESGLLGKKAVSNRLPGGIIISEIDFSTWAPRTPQTVYGYRIGTETWSGIPITSKGYQISEPDQTSNDTTSLSIPG